jgi:hypothetical protein
MSIEPGSLGSPTAQDIEAAWKAHPNPSQRTVAVAMREAGWDISPSTVMRVKNRGFAPRPIQGSGRKSKIHTAREAAQMASPEATIAKQVEAMAPPDAPRDAVAEALVDAIKNLPAGARDRVKELLDLDDQEIENRANKLVKVARLLLAEDLAQHTKMMMLVPDKAAKLYAALGTGLVMPLPRDLPETEPQVIEHNPNEPRRLSPSAQAIADFRAQRGSVAA